MTIDFSQIVTSETLRQERDKTRKASVAERRYAEEIKGIIVDGMYINTERGSQSMITGAALAAMLDSGYVCRWKTDTGFVSLDAQTLLAVSQEMRKHVQACFDREATLSEAIDNDTFTDAMLDEGWPTTGEASA
jgi:hypothetical protein